MTPDQINFVKNELARGVLPNDVKQSLRTSGYQEFQIESLFQAASGQTPSLVSVQAVTPTVPKRTGFPTWAIVLIVVVVLFLLLPIIFIGFVWFAASSALNEAGFDSSIIQEMAISGGDMSPQEMSDLTSKYLSQLTGEEMSVDFGELNFALLAQSLLLQEPVEARACDAFRGNNRVECVTDNGYIKRISMNMEDGTYICVQNNSYASESSQKPSGPNCPPGGESLEAGVEFVDNAASLSR